MRGHDAMDPWDHLRAMEGHRWASEVMHGPDQFSLYRLVFHFEKKIKHFIKSALFLCFVSRSNLTNIFLFINCNLIY